MMRTFILFVFVSTFAPRDSAFKPAPRHAKHRGCGSRISRMSAAPMRSASEPLAQDPYQAIILLQSSEYDELTTWYMEGGIDEEDLSHWGVSYEIYRDEYAAQLASMLPLSPNQHIYESAVGTGWLCRSLAELRPEATAGSTFAGNDILPEALKIARRKVPGGSFHLGDSANLTWVMPREYDLTICGYLEPSPDALVAAGFAPSAISAWVGNWVKQMCSVTRPGGAICVGAFMKDLQSYDATERVGVEFWREAAISDAYGWGVDPESLVVEELPSDLLRAEWGERYHIKMTKI